MDIITISDLGLLMPSDMPLLTYVCGEFNYSSITADSRQTEEWSRQPFPHTIGAVFFHTALRIFLKLQNAK